MSNKLELEYSQTLPVQDAFQHIVNLMNGLQQGSIHLNAEEPIQIQFPHHVEVDFKLKDKAQKGGKLEIKVEWEENAHAYTPHKEEEQFGRERTSGSRREREKAGAASS